MGPFERLTFTDEAIKGATGECSEYLPTYLLQFSYGAEGWTHSDVQDWETDVHVTSAWIPTPRWIDDAKNLVTSSTGVEGG